jgi:succinyldiaminopimelate transaminase
VAGTGVSFQPPPYPYERLDGLKKVAAQHEGGVIDCSIGTPVDPPPDEVLAELARASGARGYPASAGSLEYRSAAVEWVERRFTVTVSVDQLAACVGTKEFVATLAGYLRLRWPERDTVLYPEISYPTYGMGATLAGLRAVSVAVTDGRLDLDSISPDDRARALVLWANSPSNPTGHLDDLDTIASWGRTHDVLVASDECYAEYTWASKPRTILELGLDGVLAVHSISKRSNLAGLRAGFYTGDDDIVNYLRSVRQHAGFMVPGPVQSAVVVALRDDQHVAVQRERYRNRLELLADALSSLDISAPFPQGSFYLWCSKAGLDGWQLAQLIAERSGIVGSPGELYGEAGSDYVRLAVVQPDDRLALAASRLKES